MRAVSPPLNLVDLPDRLDWSRWDVIRPPGEGTIGDPQPPWQQITARYRDTGGGCDVTPGLFERLEQNKRQSRR